MSVLSSGIENENHQTKADSFPFLPLLLVLFLLSSVTYLAQNPLWNNDRLKIEEKSGGRNDKHANPDAQASAEQKYEEARAAWQKLKSKPNKTPAEKQLQQQLEKQVKHWKKKKDWGGENHSQNHKGN